MKRFERFDGLDTALNKKIPLHARLLFVCDMYNIIKDIDNTNSKKRKNNIRAIPCQINHFWHFLGRPISDFAQISRACSHP